ncbi:MAG: hypothetical protein GKR98_05080 [Boseongicola sp.]|nr:MAG: hypothetical protein GKR98_05080 [Boseongicola sp.]
MSAMRTIYNAEDEQPALKMIDTPWGFRLRPADMQEQAGEAVTEWALTFLGIVLLLSAFGQWILPGSMYGGDMIAMKLMLTAVLGVAGGLILSISARGFRPEVQVDKSRSEIRFVSRNPRGRGEILATVELENIIGVGMTRSIDGPDCHCLIYLLNGKKPLRLATGTEREIKLIRGRMDDYVTTPADRLAAKMSGSAAMA